MKAKAIVMGSIEVVVLAFVAWGGKLAYDGYFTTSDSSKTFVVIGLLAAVAVEVVLVWDSKRLHALIALLLQNRTYEGRLDSVVAKVLPLSLIGSALLVLLCLTVVARASRYLYHILDYMSDNLFQVALNLGVMLLCVLIPATIAHVAARWVYGHKQH